MDLKDTGLLIVCYSERITHEFRGEFTDETLPRELSGGYRNCSVISDLIWRAEAEGKIAINEDGELRFDIVAVVGRMEIPDSIVIPLQKVMLEEMEHLKRGLVRVCSRVTLLESSQQEESEAL